MDAPKVLRDSADGSGSEWVTFDEAIRKLTGYGHDEAEAREALTAGSILRTPFAFYSIPAEGEARALDGNR